MNTKEDILKNGQCQHPLTCIALSRTDVSVELLLRSEVRQRLQTKDENGDHNHHHTNDGDDTGTSRRFWVFKQHPQLALYLIVRQGPRNLFWEALVLLKPSHDFLSQLVKTQFIHEDVQRNIGRPP